MNNSFRYETTPDLLSSILREPNQDYALIARSDGQKRVVDIYSGAAQRLSRIQDIPLPSENVTGESELVVIPFCQLRERGFVVKDDRMPLLVLPINRRERLAVEEVIDRIPKQELVIGKGCFDLDDEAYGDLVRRIIEKQIGNGAGSNFVMRRTYEFAIESFTAKTPLTVFAKLLTDDIDAYWTFLIHMDKRWLVGASPEQHIKVKSGVVKMTPLSGTYRHGVQGFKADDVLQFLEDKKEINELNMVVDEELKMMARTCHSLRVYGPYLQELSYVAHTGYCIEGKSIADTRQILLESMFAPTVVGAPLENACRVIASEEPGSRGYYSGVVATLGQDMNGKQEVDSAILIRTADIASNGVTRISSGATIVRDSKVEDECAETSAKVSSLLHAFTPPRESRIIDYPGVKETLLARNDNVAKYWIDDSIRRDYRCDIYSNKRVLIIDVEDSFAMMIKMQLESLGMKVTVKNITSSLDLENYEIIIAGPGPGDPRKTDDPRIFKLHQAIKELRESGKPFIAVCLSHQVLALQLGLKLIRLNHPKQGTQQEINLFGERRLVAFYNTFAATVSDKDVATLELRNITVSYELKDNTVHAIRGNKFSSIQFHPESFITVNGPDILENELRRILLQDAFCNK